MAYYRHHVFFCTHQRNPGTPCCARHDASSLRGYMKDRCEALGLSEPGGVRVNSAGCMNRCHEGPVMVIYPEAIWYRYQTVEDVDDIITQHLMGGQPVTRLFLPEPD